MDKETGCFGISDPSRLVKHEQKKSPVRNAGAFLMLNEGRYCVSKSVPTNKGFVMNSRIVPGHCSPFLSRGDYTLSIQ
jgi:hypothetical protein